MNLPERGAEIRVELPVQPPDAQNLASTEIYACWPCLLFRTQQANLPGEWRGFRESDGREIGEAPLAEGNEQPWIAPIGGHY